jgi:uncharacterized membrane protein YfcA
MTVDSVTVAVCVIVFVSALVRTVFGFGNALIAMPLLAMTGVGMKTATPLVALLCLVLGIVLLVANWKKVDIRSSWRLLLATVPGIPLGTMLLKGDYQRMGEIALALIIIGFSGYSLLKPRLIKPIKEWQAYPFGFLAGILGGAYNSNGPPVIIYGTLRKWLPDEFRATLQSYFLPSSVIIVAGHGLGGLWTSEVGNYFFLSLPLTLFAIWIGGRVQRLIPPGHFDRWIHMLMIVIGGMLLFKAVFPS